MVSKQPEVFWSPPKATGVSLFPLLTEMAFIPFLLVDPRTSLSLYVTQTYTLSPSTTAC